MLKKEFLKYTLPNGIRCVHKRTNSPVAYCSLTIGAGSRDEQSREAGLAHFTEHLLFKGTQHRRAHHINNRLEKLGGELNAFTTKEETVVHTTSLRSDIARATELISDVVFHSVFPEKEVEKEREVILEEIASYKDSPPERIYDEFEDMLFAGSSLGHNILGARSSVKSFSSEDIREFTGRTYNTDRMVFSVGANISGKSFISLVERHLGGVAPSTGIADRMAPPPVTPFDVTLNRRSHQAHCIVGARAYNLYQPRRVVLSLLTNLLGGPAANSLLNTLLREKHGLTYSVEASYTPYCDTGVAAIYFGTEKDKVDLCMELVEGEIKKLCSVPLTTMRLAAAKKQFIGQLSIAMESQEGYMLGAGKSYLVYDDADPAPQIYRKISEITAQQITETANEVFGNVSRLVYNGGRH